MLPLSPTWRIDFPVSGDTIGECLFDLPLEHAEILSGKLHEQWHLAAVRANSLRGEFADAPEQLAELGLMEALDILFASAHNIFRFYLLRSEEKGFTPEMRAIAEQEIRHSERMKNWCLKDSRLGFHSEAENYKFFPDKLEARIAFLKEMLANPLPELTSEIHDISDRWQQADQYKWQMEDTGRTVKIHVVVSNIYRVDQMFAALQGRPETPPAVIGVTRNNEPIGSADGASVKAVNHGDHWETEFEIPWENIPLCNGTFRFGLVRLFIRKNICEYAPCPNDPGEAVFRLRIGYHLPQYMMTFRRIAHQAGSAKIVLR